MSWECIFTLGASRKRRKGLGFYVSGELPIATRQVWMIMVIAWGMVMDICGYAMRQVRIRAGPFRTLHGAYGKHWIFLDLDADKNNKKVTTTTTTMIAMAMGNTIATMSG